MGRSKIKNSRGDASDRDVAKEVEERCVSIISNLFQVCGQCDSYKVSGRTVRVRSVLQ
jgi:hypothetical protein